MPRAPPVTIAMRLARSIRFIESYLRLPFGQGPDVWLAELAALPLVHQPGERVTYSHAIDVLGVLVSRIEGKPFNQVLDERILLPLGMADTGFCVPLEARHPFAILCEETASPSVLDLRKRLQAVYPKAKWHEYEALTRDAELEGSRLAFGKGVRSRP